MNERFSYALDSCQTVMERSNTVGNRALFLSYPCNKTKRGKGKEAMEVTSKLYTSELNDIQKKILIGCLKYEESVCIPVWSFQGVAFLCVNMDLPINNQVEYLQIQNNWVADLIGVYLVRAKENTYKLTEEGLKAARKLRDEMQAAGA